MCVLLSCAFHLCRRPPSSPADECCEMLDSLVTFGSPVFWGNSQPGVVDWKDWVMMSKCGGDRNTKDCYIMARWWSHSSVILVKDAENQEEQLLCVHKESKPQNVCFFLFCLQGLYVFVVYFIMHNQVCWPTKASYTVEMNGHDGPDVTYPGGGPTSIGGDISKSTQNLISAMEEVFTQNLLWGLKKSVTFFLPTSGFKKHENCDPNVKFLFSEE